MKPKKIEKLQLEKYSGLFFVTGLAMALLLSYIALEWVTLEETIICSFPILEHPLPERQDIEETSNTTSAQNPNTLSFPIPYYPIEEEINDDEFRCLAIAEAPVFPGCENAKDKRECLQEMMLKHIRDNFEYPETAISLGVEGKVFVQFMIETDGCIGDIKTRGPNTLLEREAVRIISKLPKMAPGKHQGVAVKVPFSIPINFVLQ